jgi:hypothetical protein
MAACLLAACGSKADPAPTTPPGLETQPGETDLGSVSESGEPAIDHGPICQQLEVTVHPQGEKPRRYELDLQDGAFKHTDDTGTIEGTIAVYHQDICRVALIFRAPDGNVVKTLEAEATNGKTHTVASAWSGGIKKVLITPSSGSAG